MKIDSTLISDEEKLNLSPGDLFDRIINLKITCIDGQNRKESFVIRSDYELIWDDVYNEALSPNRVNEIGAVKGCHIRRCTNKPSIKVQYKMATSNLGTMVHVYVENFFLLTKDGKHLRSFNATDYHIQAVEIAMGYWGQFRVGKESEASAPSYNDYFDITAKNGADKITLTGAIVVTTDKLPPDSVLHIKGYVGDIYQSPVTLSAFETTEQVSQNPIVVAGDNLKEIMKKCITRRYLNWHSIIDAGKNAWSSIKESWVSTKQVFKLSNFTDWEFPVPIDLMTGLIDGVKAEYYGTKVYLSEKLKNFKIPKVKDSKGEEKPKKFFFESGWTIGQTITRISSFFGINMNYTFDENGNVLVYTAEEASDPETLSETYSEDADYSDRPLSKKELYDNKLPAVYNINVDAVATISCPFFTFISPFQYLEFASRYALTSDVSFWADYNPTISAFYAISASITFATVENINDVQITAVAKKDVEKYQESKA